ncbi:MAG: NAD(P)H-binding protein [Wenzhouxiangella sp.]
MRAVARGAKIEVMPPGVTGWPGDVHDGKEMEKAMDGVQAAVYLPGMTAARTRDAFHRIHVEAPRRCATIARRAGVRRFIHLSALGAATDAPAWSDQTKAEGELAVSDAFAETTIVRPSLVLGPGSHFASSMQDRMRRLPVMPVIGSGTRIQPVHLDDLVSGLHAALMDDKSEGTVYQAGGPRVVTMLDLLRIIRESHRLRCRLVPLTRATALTLAMIAERLPGQPLVCDQVRLMDTDKVLDGVAPTLAALGVDCRDPL